MFKKEIIQYTIEGLMKHLSVSYEEANELVVNANIDKCIERAPELWSHMNQEQLVYEVVR